MRHRRSEPPVPEATSGERWPPLKRCCRYLVSLGIGLIGGYTVSKVWAETS